LAWRENRLQKQLACLPPLGVFEKREWRGGGGRWGPECQGEEFLCPWSEEEEEVVEEEEEQEGWNCVGLAFP